VDAKLGCDDDDAGSALGLSFGATPVEGIPELLPEDEAGMGGELWSVKREEWLVGQVHFIGRLVVLTGSARPARRKRVQGK
jgi:hypothetical protein